jgi:putative ABC transport system permease protein
LRDTRGTPRPTIFCYPTFFDFRNQNRVFEHIVSYRDSEFSLTGFEQPVQLRGAVVSWDLFPLLQVQPVPGRGFLASEEDPGQRSVILSHELWKARFAGDTAIIGRPITLDRQPYAVVGIAPEAFNFPVGNNPIQVWTTLGRESQVGTVQPVTKQRGARMLNVIARLKPGVSIEQAQIELDAVATAVARDYPASNKNLASTYVRPELETMTGDTRRPILFLLGAVGLVLLIACANIANLLLVRTAEREREFALRTAIGAGRGRIARQVVTESLMLSFVGCAAGVLAATWLLKLVVPLAGDSIPRIQQAAIDTNVLAFSVALAVLTGVLFSLAPAMRLLRLELNAPLKEASRTSAEGSDRLRSALVVAQVALGLVLLSGASLLIASFLHLMRRDIGFRPERLLTFNVSVPPAEYSRPRQLQFHAQLLENLRSLPGITSAALGMPLPLTGSQMSVSFNIQERPAPPYQRPRSNMAIVSPGYFRTIGVPLLQGREFTERDDADAPLTLIVNRAFADRFFPGEDAVGKRIEPGATSDASGTKMREIVGIVGNAKQSPLNPDAEPIYYFPYQQMPWCCPPVIVRTAESTLAIESSIRGVVATLDKQMPVYDVRTLDVILAQGIARPRFQMLLLGSFAALALLLTVVGLYGVVAYSVVRRTREIGVRMALGAGRDIVMGMVLRQAMLLVALGMTIGVAGALASGRLMSKMLYGVGSGDPLLMATACLVVAAATALAAYLPARRAASIDPMQALRSE